MNIIMEANLLIWMFIPWKLIYELRISGGHSFESTSWQSIQSTESCRSVQPSSRACNIVNERKSCCDVLSKSGNCFIFYWINLKKYFRLPYVFAFIKTFIENTTFTLNQWLAETFFSQDRYSSLRRHSMDRKVAAFSRIWGLIFWKKPKVRTL